jgi:hypothetical protein
MSDDLIAEFRYVLDNLTDPAVKARWDRFANAFNRRQTTYRIGDAEGNALVYDQIKGKLAAGYVNAKRQYNSSFDVLSERQMARYPTDSTKQELVLMRDGLEMDNWDLATEIVIGLREVFLQDVHAFIAAFVAQFREQVGAQILPQIHRLDSTRAESLIENTLHTLYAVIDIAIE